RRSLPFPSLVDGGGCPDRQICCFPGRRRLLPRHLFPASSLLTPVSKSLGSVPRAAQHRAAHCRQGSGHRRHGLLLPGGRGRPGRSTHIPISVGQASRGQVHGDVAIAPSSLVVLDPAIAHRRPAGGARSRLIRLAGSTAR
uniref:Uncharacterized protein n=1 Tax=Triticum urartu TaxID=4572 RepID=A0A8R7UQC4_TRIUA